MDSKIKNVVFDLGGVLINLDFDNCLNAFRKAGFRDIEKQACQFRGKGFFSQFELGEISPEEFRKAIRKEVSEALSDHEIDDMWNVVNKMSKLHSFIRSNNFSRKQSSLFLHVILSKISFEVMVLQ